MSIALTELQSQIASFPAEGTLIVTGPAGSGKTTASVERMKNLSANIKDADSILIVAPQRSLAKPYLDAIQTVEFNAPAPHSVLTIGGLAQRSISLFWPLIAREAGFAQYKKNPIFLTLELTQFYLSKLVDPLIDKGYFSSISIDRIRLYSQIIDNLNKSAVIGFAPETISSRLAGVWAGKSDQTGVFNQAQECALLFRNFCLEHNLLDFSLQIQVFTHTLWKSFIYRQYLKNKYQHLIYENVEEDFPVAHDIVAEWLPDLQSAVFLMDNNGGFRTFLGADPVSARRFLHLAVKQVELNDTFGIPMPVSVFSSSLTEAILNHSIKRPVNPAITTSFEVQSYRFVPEALESISRKVQSLIVENNVPPGEIAILTPFLSDSLLFSTLSCFNHLGVPVKSFRPSRGLKDEPAVKAFLTLAKITFPGMGLLPDKEDVRNTLMTTITGCDLIRADMLAQMLYSTADNQPVLRVLDTEKNVLRDRLTSTISQRFERLRTWLAEAQTSGEVELDVFFSRLFGELLSQEGFNFHSNANDSSVINQLILSCRKFRQTVTLTTTLTLPEMGKTYIELVENGILSSQYNLSHEDSAGGGSVLIAPAHSFLMKNTAVQYQFWLDIGSAGWWTRLDQPLTQPYVLNRNWIEGSRWTDAEEFSTNQNNLSRLVQGLLNHCSRKVIMAAIDISQQGNEERGALMIAVQTMLKKLHQSTAVEHV